MPIHSEQRDLPYRPEQLFDMVADVGRYPQFLPWCIAARIVSREEAQFDAELVIGFKGMRERFISRVSLDRENRRIDVRYIDGPFKYLENRWRFEPLDSAATGCRLDFHVDFEFRSRLLEAVMGGLFHQAVRRMVGAFETRAAALYGPPDA